MCSISTRQSIQFSSDPAPLEPTSTLVLTAPSGRFIDIRILKSAFADVSTHSTHAAQGGNGQEHGIAQQRQRSEIECGMDHLNWGFWGLAESTDVTWLEVASAMHMLELRREKLDEITSAERSVHAEREGKVRWCRWEHYLDSMIHLGKLKEVDDQGLMFETQNPGEELEVGKMENPRTGVVEEYEEVWRDADIRCPEWLRRKFAVWQCIADGPSEKHKVKGAFVRVGQFAQGIMVRNDTMVVERWEAGTQDGNWKRVCKIAEQQSAVSDPFLPLLDGEDAAHRGAIAVLDGVRWQLVEEG
jgi:hypothetical protein